MLISTGASTRVQGGLEKSPRRSVFRLIVTLLITIMPIALWRMIDQWWITRTGLEPVGQPGRFVALRIFPDLNLANASTAPLFPNPKPHCPNAWGGGRPEAYAWRTWTKFGTTHIEFFWKCAVTGFVSRTFRITGPWPPFGPAW